jgi:predicted phosphodiesterase
LRIAVVSDIHGNMTALEAVIADLETVAPDLVVHGGDLCSGSRAADVIDRIRGLGWPGVYGNTDEMLWVTGKADDYLAGVGLHRMREIVARQIAFTLAELGPDRLAWLRGLPLRWAAHNLAVVHSRPDDAWSITPADAPDEEMARIYGPLASRHVVYGHIHRPFVRRLPGFVLGNSGCLSLSYDGDPRAAYALVEPEGIAIRRVEYDIEREARELVSRGFPYAAWMAEILRKASYVDPPGGTSAGN